MIEILEDIGEIIFGSKRQAALKHFASSKGFTYRRRLSPDLLPLEVQRMGFIDGKKGKSLKGVLSKKEEANDAQATIFDYVHYHEFGNKTTTVFLYECSKMGLPNFTIKPRGSLSRIGNIFSTTEWSSVNKDFDREFIVESSQMNDMRMMITIQFAEVMLDVPGFTLEGRDEYLALYKVHSIEDIIDMDNHHFSALELIDIILHDNSNELI